MSENSENIVDKINLKVDNKLLNKLTFMQGLDNESMSQIVREAIELRYALIQNDLLRDTTAKIISTIK